MFKKIGKMLGEYQIENDRLKQRLYMIKQLLEDALYTDKTSAKQSFDNFYKAIELCEVIDEN